MNPYYERAGITIYHGDCRDVLPTLDACSVDAIVTDPPAGISFMGKSWDGDRGGRSEWVAWMTEVMGECLRILKPGGHALVWALPRTSHWTATALEDAGFELRDQIMHLFGSGFPKSLDVSKAIDKAAGADREIVGTWQPTGTARIKGNGNSGHGYDHGELRDSLPITAPATPEAAQWDGWGTALKPAYEIWWLCRKPLSESTVAANVLRWGTGAINVDGCRIETGDKTSRRRAVVANTSTPFGRGLAMGGNGSPSGRWPANLILSHSLFCTDDGCADDCPVAGIDRQSGHTAGKPRRTPMSPARRDTQYSGGYSGQDDVEIGYPDSGGASRFFYVAKASKAERERGLDELPLLHRVNGNKLTDQDYRVSRGERPQNAESGPRRNVHPTVKPLALMTYLCTLICPPGGTILDPFAGSGSTGVAALSAGFAFVGVEREAEYVEIARRRIDHLGIGSCRLDDMPNQPACDTTDTGTEDSLDRSLSPGPAIA